MVDIRTLLWKGEMHVLLAVNYQQWVIDYGYHCFFPIPKTTSVRFISYSLFLISQMWNWLLVPCSFIVPYYLFKYEVVYLFLVPYSFQMWSWLLVPWSLFMTYLYLNLGTAYVDVANNKCDVVGVVEDARVLLVHVHFKWPVTYSKTDYCFGLF